MASCDHGYVSRLKYRALKSGLSVGHVFVGGFFIGEPRQAAKMVAQVKSGIDTAVLLGAPMVRVFAAPPAAEDANPEHTWAQIIRCYQEIADYADDRAIVVGVCNHNRGSGRPRGDDIVRLCIDVGRNNVSVILDTGQWWPNYSTGKGTFEPNELAYGYMEQVMPHTVGVAAKIYDIKSGREEFIDYERVFGMLKAADFNGYLSIYYKRTYTEVNYRDGIALAADYLRGLAGRAGL